MSDGACPLVPPSEREGFLRSAAITPGMAALLTGPLPRRLLWGDPTRARDALTRWEAYPALVERRWCAVTYDLGRAWLLSADGTFASFDREGGVGPGVDERAFFQVAVVENALGPLDEAEELVHWASPDRITDPDLRSLLQELAALHLPYFADVLGEIWPAP